MCFAYNFSVRVLFIFDTEFYRAFDGEDRKSADEHMDEVLSIVKNAFKDKTIKRDIGTHINIIAERQIFNGSLYVHLLICISSVRFKFHIVLV